jgi:hypothetical protein
MEYDNLQWTGKRAREEKIKIFEVGERADDTVRGVHNVRVIAGECEGNQGFRVKIQILDDSGFYVRWESHR